MLFARMKRAMFWSFMLGLVAVPAVWANTGSFAETEEGQISVITSHGAIQLEYSDVEEAHVTKEYSENDMAMMRADMEQPEGGEDSGDSGETDTRRKRHAGRVKRFLSSKASLIWPKAIVPYDFSKSATRLVSEQGKAEIYAAHSLWHKYTCVRFVPWVQGETREKYGLPDEGHVTHSKGDSCSASQGCYHNPNGQWNSCCGRMTCIHELGHTMGLWHEHQNYRRTDFTRLDWDKIDPGQVWTYRAIQPSAVLNWEYDSSNTMHYGFPFSSLYEDLRSVIRMNNQYYMYKDVALSHDCKALHCGDFSVECHNDGFVTLVDDQCSCLCPPGLDPDTGCTTTVKSVTTVSAWPAGAYAMFSPKEGCPGADVFQEGAWQHWSKGRSKQSPQVSLGGDYTAEYYKHEFCVKPAQTDESGTDWQAGRYCILRAGGECPKAFQTGYMQFDDSPEHGNEGSGQMPDGVFGNDTRLEFCCRDDGFHFAPLTNVPNTEPLVLFPNNHNRGHCQEVAGMRWSKEFIEFHSFSDTSGTGGEFPSGPTGGYFKMKYCHYFPANYDCGGEITLSSSNKEVVITSPNFPSPYDVNTECNWVIKTEKKDSKILLNFDKFELTSTGETCEDSLEIRYNLPGQPGIRYCGDGLSRIIRSLNDIVLLTLRSDQHQVDSDHGFRLTASLHDPETEECYAPASRGTLYRGDKNYTRGMRPCLAWSEVTHCPHHAFNTGDLGEGLDCNYCRNPDVTAQPWCYHSAKTCQRDYCDVCNVERRFDLDPLCDEETVCAKTKTEIVADGCAGTCHLEQEPTPPNREQTCGRPPTLSDGELQENPQDSYTVGQTVTYKCSSGSATVVSTCLSEGQWSPIGYVCGACSPGWDYNGENCYKLFDAALSMVTWNEAQKVCQEHGANLVSIKSAEEQEFVSSLRALEYMTWIGASDSAKEGTFLWADGSNLEYKNWNKGQPNNYRNQDCVSMQPKYRGARWDDDQCDSSRYPTFICKVTPSERTTCTDRDRDDCRALLTSTPHLCSQHAVFAKHQCPYSCGICQQDATAPCSLAQESSDIKVVSPAGQDSLARGEVVTFACGEGLVLTGGQLNLTCGDDGKEIGELPVCQHPDSLVEDSNDNPLIARPNAAYSRYSYMGVGSKMVIHRHGVIKQWKFYSSQPGWSVFQIWRNDPAAGPNGFMLVGLTQVMTKGQGEETYDIPESDWISVQPDDRLAEWEGSAPLSRGRVPYDNCRNGKNNDDYGVRRGPVNYRADFSFNAPSTFSTRVYCRVFSYKAVIYPLDSVPVGIDTASNQAPLFVRGSLGDAKKVYLGDSANFDIPSDGFVKQWQFIVKSTGQAALQVWRPRPDLGTDSFEFVGQTMLDIPTSDILLHNMTLSGEERIPVKTGDVTGIWYASQRLGVPFDYCKSRYYPEGGDMRRSGNLEANTLSAGDVVSIPLLTAKPCYKTSFRAIISQN